MIDTDFGKGGATLSFNITDFNLSFIDIKKTVYLGKMEGPPLNPQLEHGVIHHNPVECTYNDILSIMGNLCIFLKVTIEKD